jgi:S1-C subfamily serine protease
MILNFRRFLTMATLAIILSVAVVINLYAQDTTSVDLERIQRATVFIMQARSVGNDRIISCVGTGTIVSRDGLILTNAHNTLPSATCPGDTLLVGLNIRLDEAPIPRFQAEIVQADPGLDLALLRISRESDGQLVEPGSLTLPFVELGDSASVQLDDTITVIGFPSIGDEPISVERGTVTGFMAEPSGGDKSWIKTSAVIRGTMSGGGAYNQRGELIGIPTTAPLSSSSPEASCLILQDTNMDGLVNSNDSCIPIGGFINSLRPSNFVRPLLRAASLGLTVEMVTTIPEQTLTIAEPSLRYLGFSPSVNEAGMPTSIIRSLPTGSDSLYLFFDYENMTPETVYELRVFTNGILNSNFSLSPVRWSGGQRGLWYVGSSGQPWPNGVYDFTLLVNGVAAGNARLLVGEVTQGTSQFSDLVFGLRDLQGGILGNGFVLPTGNVAFARFLYRNMTTGTPWAAIWYYQGQEVQRTEAEWLAEDGASGTKDISVQSETGLLPGSYRLELYVENRLAAVSDFTLAGAHEGAFARIFSDVHFTTASSPEEAQNAARISSFSGGTQSIYSLFNWEQIAQGTLWRVEWTVDGEPFYQRTLPWNGTSTGEHFLMRLTSPTGVPDGAYEMNLYINNLPFASTDARVGIGQLPIDRFQQAEGVQLRGQLLDSETLEGVPGVSVLLISEDFSVADFTRDWQQDQLYDMSTTDRNGRFQIERPLQRDVPYSIVIIAEGYLPLTADGVEITDDNHPDNSPVEVLLHLTRG